MEVWLLENVVLLILSEEVLEYRLQTSKQQISYTMKNQLNIEKWREAILNYLIFLFKKVLY